MNKALVDEYRDLKLAKPFDDKFAIHLPLERNARDFDSDVILFYLLFFF